MKMKFNGLVSTLLLSGFLIGCKTPSSERDYITSEGNQVFERDLGRLEFRREKGRNFIYLNGEKIHRGGREKLVISDLRMEDSDGNGSPDSMSYNAVWAPIPGKKCKHPREVIVNCKKRNLGSWRFDYEPVGE